MEVRIIYIMPEKTVKKTTGKPVKKKNPMETEGFTWRVGVSIVAFFALIIFLIIWLFFYADLYTVYQNIAVIIVGILAFLGIMGGTWAPWGMKHADEFDECK